MSERYDLAVVGAGIVGLAHALAAARLGLKVVVLDRDGRANGASIRNFGLVVVSGQQPGPSRRRAERTRQIWLDLAADAGFEILQRGKIVAAQRSEAMAVLEAFKAGGQGEACRLLTAAELAGRQPGLDQAALAGGLYSPFEIRVESKDVLPRLVGHLAARYGVTFRFGTAVHGVGPSLLSTSAGDVAAEKIVVCPGDDLSTLFPEIMRAGAVGRCKLQMLRLADPGIRLPSALMSDFSLLRYGGYAGLPAAAALRARLEKERPEMLARGVHLIVAQSADGSMVLGDSHDYGTDPDPFASEEVDRLILSELSTLFPGIRPRVVARWVGTYATSSKGEILRAAPHEGVRLVVVTSGTGASTGFALGEETMAELFGDKTEAYEERDADRLPAARDEWA